MKYLFNHWDKVSRRIKTAPHIFLFFDYDGTLTPIVSKPEQAKFPSRVKNPIKKLLKNPKITIAIISGRSLKNIKKMVGLKGIIYVGNHGLEMKGRTQVHSFMHIIKKIRTSLQKLKEINGVRVEDKGVTLSLHFRLVKPKYKSVVKNRFKRIVEPFVCFNKVKICSGKEVLEVRPNLSWNKGSAVNYLLKKKKNALPLYVGDDITDIDAFRAIKGKGISIFVRGTRKNIKADYFLKNTKEVQKFIQLIWQNEKTGR